MTTGAERFLRQVEGAPQVALLGLDLGPLAQDGLELSTTPRQPGHPGGLVEDLGRALEVALGSSRLRRA